MITIMKKTYISPSILVVKINTEAMIAESLAKRATGADEGVVLVKRDRSSYSVWDEDWSN